MSILDALGLGQEIPRPSKLSNYVAPEVRYTSPGQLRAGLEQAIPFQSYQRLLAENLNDLSKQGRIPYFDTSAGRTPASQFARGVANIPAGAYNLFMDATGLAAAPLAAATDRAFSPTYQTYLDETIMPIAEGMIAQQNASRAQSEKEAFMRERDRRLRQGIAGGPSYDETPTEADQNAAITAQMRQAQDMGEVSIMPDGSMREGNIFEAIAGLTSDPYAIQEKLEQAIDPDSYAAAAQRAGGQAREAAEAAIISDDATVDGVGRAEGETSTNVQGDVTDITDQPDDLVEQKADSAEEVEGVDLGEGQTAAEKAFMSGMEAYKTALGEDASVGSIEDYKKEFAEATGIDVSGKVDNSAALMSFGLALMQNKAGKGFNVGRMLSSVGEAGEKAMPAVMAARKEAKAGQLAAGKYALGERGKAITNAIARRNKIADRIAELSDKAYDRDTQLMVEGLKGRIKLEDRRIQELAANQRESTKSLAAAGELGSLTKINLGGDDAQSKFEIQVQQVGKTGAFQFLDADGEMDRVNGMLKSADSQIATVNKMFDIAEAGDVSGAEGTYNYIASKLKGVGISLPGAQPEKIEEYNAAMGKLLTQARRLLTGGEAGNAISDRDVRIMEQNMGLERDSAGGILFSSPNQAMEYVQNLKELFSRKKEELVTVKTRLYELGLRNGHYIDYKEPDTGQLISENENFADDFAGYEAQIVDGKIRYTIKK